MILMANKKKELGQVFTPHKIVEYMLKMTKYDGNLSKTVFEPSFGDGAFLCTIFETQIQWGRANGYSDEEIAKYVDEHLYGNELDPYWYEKAKSNLDKVAEHNQFTGVCSFPHVTNGDTLSLTDYYGKMDYVIGNPPYVKIGLLSQEIKEQIADYMFTGGSTDLYIIFYEFCMNCLKEESQSHLIFITPRTYMNNDSCTAFRRYLIRNNYIEDLVDYGASKVFPNADVYVSILHLNTHKETTKMGYYEGSASDLTPELPTVVVELTDYDDITAAAPWDFNSSTSDKEITLGDICNIDGGFEVGKKAINVQSGYYGEPKHILFNGFMVENAVLMPVLKGSAYIEAEDYDTVLFPYVYDEATMEYRRLTLEELEAQYPRCFRFLNYHKVLLTQQNGNDDWWGKAVVDANMFKAPEGYKRFTIKSVISPEAEKVILTELPDGVGVYSGFIFTVPNNRVKFVTDIIESSEFLEYLRGISRIMSGNFIVPRLTGLRSYRACTYEQWKEIE